MSRHDAPRDGVGADAPIIVTALFGDADAAVFNALRRKHFPTERNHLAAHLTMFHHLPPAIAAELKQRLRGETRGVPPPRTQVSGLISLGQGVAFSIESAELADIRTRLAQAFATLLMPQDRAGWRPHVTVQNKVDSAVARALRDELARDFCPRPVKIAGLAAWWYRGGPWEPLSRHAFG